MNRLVIIGNGFDMAHGLRSSYMDFINWYWDQRVYGFIGNTTNVSQDCLCKLVIKETGGLAVGMCLQPQIHTSLRIYTRRKDILEVKSFKR